MFWTGKLSIAIYLHFLGRYVHDWHLNLLLCHQKRRPTFWTHCFKKLQDPAISAVMAKSLLHIWGLSQDFKNACPKQQFQNFCPSRFSYIYFKSLYQPHLIAYCVKKGILHFSYVLEDGLIGKHLVITPKNQN